MMKLHFYFPIFLFLGLLSGVAPVLACTVIHESFVSKILTVDAAHPYLEKYLVILPEGYDPRRSYGTVYFLHGRDNSGKMVTDIGGCQQLDRLVAEKRNPFVIIAPDGGNSYFKNEAHGLRFADMFTQEVIAHAESKYSLIREGSARIVAGISMGGGAAFWFALKYPSLFGAGVGAHSPVIRDQLQVLQGGFANQFGTGKDFEERDPYSQMTLYGKRLLAPIFFDIAAKDAWYLNAKKCADYLKGVNTRGEFHVGEDIVNGHDGAYWSSNAWNYFLFYSSLLPKVR